MFYETFIKDKVNGGPMTLHPLNEGKTRGVKLMQQERNENQELTGNRHP